MLDLSEALFFSAEGRNGGGRGNKEISGQQGLQRNVRRLRSWVRGLKIWVRRGSDLDVLSNI